MTHSGWIATPVKKNDNTGALLALLLLILGLGVSGSLFRYAGTSPSPCGDPVFLEAAGDVARPGVYGFYDTPATAPALAVRAGGSLNAAEAAVEGVHLSSGTRVVFFDGAGEEAGYRIEEMNAFYLMTLGMPVPVNLCSPEELTALPGIGPGLSRAIADHRDQVGGFDRAEDIMKVRGIGPRTVERLKPHITVRRAADSTGYSSIERVGFRALHRMGDP